ncbi:MAG: PAS domain-containing sensor histidine kinase, partial [Betaproteobacteria bacterium]|nr:PAS domain-containing sensor histidine kinase [Betaproteobacteria bacterium]
MPFLPPGLSPSAADAPFVRMWRGFLTGRVMVALALLFLQGLGQFINLAAEPATLAVCVAYLAVTLAERALAGRAPPPPAAGPRWLAFIGVDLAAVCALQLLQAGSMNYTPLFGLPILMAAVLGTLTQ